MSSTNLWAWLLVLVFAQTAQAQAVVLPPQVIVGRIGELLPVFVTSRPGAAFVAADRPLEPLYTPALDKQWNSTGADNVVLRTAVGEYFVKLPGLGGTGGTVQVTAYGAGNARCKVVGWLGIQALLAINVRCFRGDEQADSRFVASFERVASSTRDVAYVLQTHTNFRDYEWVAEPAYARTVRTIYRGGGFEQPQPGVGGITHVTAFGPGPEHCTLTTATEVACFDAEGEKVSADFVWGQHREGVANAGRRGAYVSYNPASPASATNPFVAQNQWGTTQPISVLRRGAGQYLVSLPGMPSGSKTAPMVSALDLDDSSRRDSTHCKPFAWYEGDEGETIVEVRCYAVGGELDGEQRDAQFNLSYLTQR